VIEVAIIGAGFSGIGLAVKLRERGIEDFVVLERGDAVGGTWWANTYPGCTCDVPSNLYSFSFAPNPDWTSTYSPQPEIREYLERVVEGFGVAPHVRLNTELRGARWDGDGWELDTSGGPLRARVLVSAAGPLVEPRLPDFPGLERFEGPAFHSARWDHSVDLTGKRVASIGTGASAIQYVPEIAPAVERLYVVQRTPPWVIAHGARPTRRWERRLFRAVPAAQRAARAWQYATRELLVLGFVKQPRAMQALELLARRHMRRQLRDPDLIARATPRYTIGCKRILPSNRWYPALARDNVELVTEGVREVRARSLVLDDGRELEIDALIFGTGFNVLDLPIAKLIRGRDGRTLADTWQGSPHAYLGTAVPGFPNLFLMLGPNTGLGHSSMVYMIESQIAYIVDALRVRGVAEVRPDVEARYNAELQRRLRGTVWATGCSAWYQDAAGNIPTLWPDWTWRFRRRAARFDPADYVIAG
jgi:cation diffusion facilitator CzcD-associated flavoprotein CzcO